VSAQTIYAWRKHFGSLEPSDVKRLRQLEQENSRLKKMVADRDFEIDVLKEITRKNGRRTYAVENMLADGTRQIVIATDKPVSFAAAAGGSRVMDYPFTLIEMRPNEKGEGTMLAASSVLTNKNGKLEIENYGQEPARLTSITEGQRSRRSRRPPRYGRGLHALRTSEARRLQSCSSRPTPRAILAIGPRDRDSGLPIWTKASVGAQATAMWAASSTRAAPKRSAVWRRWTKRLTTLSSPRRGRRRIDAARAAVAGSLLTQLNTKQESVRPLRMNDAAARRGCN